MDEVLRSTKAQFTGSEKNHFKALPASEVFATSFLLLPSSFIVYSFLYFLKDIMNSKNIPTLESREPLYVKF